MANTTASKALGKTLIVGNRAVNDGIERDYRSKERGYWRKERGYGSKERGPRKICIE